MDYKEVIAEGVSVYKQELLEVLPELEQAITQSVLRSKSTDILGIIKKSPEFLEEHSNNTLFFLKEIDDNMKIIEKAHKNKEPHKETSDYETLKHLGFIHRRFAHCLNVNAHKLQYLAEDMLD